MALWSKDSRPSPGSWIRHKKRSPDAGQHPSARERGIHTGLLLLHGQILPIHLHAVSERHPQIGLLLRRHLLPSLLNVGKGWVGDGMGLAGLLELAGYWGSPGESCAGRGRWNDDVGAARSPGEGGA